MTATSRDPRGRADKRLLRGRPGRWVDGCMRHNRSIPSSTVIPVLSYPDVREAVTWLAASFGFAERVRISGHQQADERECTPGQTGSDHGDGWGSVQSIFGFTPT